MKTLRKIVSAVTILELVLALVLPNFASAATLTDAQDQLSTNKASVAANHTFYFVTPTGITVGQTMEITMNTFAVPALMSFADVDIAEGDSGTCSTASFSEITVGAAQSGLTWGFVSSDATDTLTFTAGSAGITAGRCVRIKVGTHATGGVYQIVNSIAGSQGIMIGSGTMADSSYIAVAIVADPQVDLSAYVGSSLTMSLSSTSADIGALSSGSTTTGSTTVTINTNSNSGYSLKYSATNLTNQSAYSLAALASKTAANPGTEQWGLNAASVNNTASGTDSTATASSNYDTASSYMVVPGVETMLASASGTAQNHAYTVTYGVDIGALTPAGMYTGTVDYLVYGAF